MTDHQLYLIVWGPYVRIGSALDPIDRLGRVGDTRPPRTVPGSPELVGTVPGGFGAESWLTASLAAHKAGNGWYHLRGPIAELVGAAARSGIDEVSAAPRPVRLRTGDGLFFVTSARGPVAERRQHVMLMPEATPAGLRLIYPQPALCGAGVSLVVGRFGTVDALTCTACRRALPARTSS